MIAADVFFFFPNCVTFGVCRYFDIIFFLFFRCLEHAVQHAVRFSIQSRLNTDEMSVCYSKNNINSDEFYNVSTQYNKPHSSHSLTL